MARRKPNKRNSAHYLGENPYPSVSAQPQGTDPYAYLREQPAAPVEVETPSNVPGSTLGDHVDPSIPQAPASLEFLPQDPATDGGLVPTRPRQPGKRPRLLVFALFIMWWIGGFLGLISIFLITEFGEDTGVFSPRPMTLTDKLLLIVMIAFTAATIAIFVFTVLAYSRLWAAIGLSLAGAAIGLIFQISDAGVIGWAPLAVSLLCYLPPNLRYYQRTRRYRQETKAYEAFGGPRALHRA